MTKYRSKILVLLIIVFSFPLIAQKEYLEKQSLAIPQPVLFENAKNSNYFKNIFTLSGIDSNTSISNTCNSTSDIFNGKYDYSNVEMKINMNREFEQLVVYGIYFEYILPCHISDLKVLDVYGNIKLSLNIENLIPKHKSSWRGDIGVDISTLPFGIYFVKIGDKFSKFVKL